MKLTEQSRVAMSDAQRRQWFYDRARQSKQHPAPHVRSRGDHYRRKNTGAALRTYRMIKLYGAVRW